MKGPAKTALLAVAVLVLVGGAFWGGMALQSSKSPAGLAAPGDAASGMGGGPMANLSEEERAQFESMTDEERQAWIEENRDSMAGGMGGPTRGGNLEGEVIEVTDDSLTISLESGTQTVYLDDDTVVAYVKGAADLAAGSQVQVVAGPAGGTPGSESTTSGEIVTASLVVVTE